MNKTLEELQQEIVALKTTAEEAIESAKNDSSKFEEAKALVDGTEDKPGLKAQVERLELMYNEKLQEEEFKAMQSQVTDLQSVIQDLRKPAGKFVFATGDTDSADADDPYAEGTGNSFFNDLRLSFKGTQSARERLTQGLEGLNEEGKAMTEGVDGQGGYLVRPVIERQLVEARELDNKLRGLCSVLNVNTNGIQLDQLTLSTTAGWVAELAQKPEGTGMTLSTVTASVFTAAGLVTASNQLLADSNPAVDQLVIADLNKRLVALEETAFLSGSGTNQPLGILNTPGLGATPLTSTSVVDLLTAILAAVGDVETNHGSPTAILMHPRTWTRIIQSRDSAGAWFINPSAPGQSDFVGNRTVFRGPQLGLWGYPVVLSNRIPTNLGGGTNESRVIVGDFKEALILDRQGITVDESKHVFFTTNQTVFRVEERVGFTAARNPGAFNVIGGVGLAAG